MTPDLPEDGQSIQEEEINPHLPDLEGADRLQETFLPVKLINKENGTQSSNTLRGFAKPVQDAVIRSKKSTRPQTSVGDRQQNLTGFHAE